MVFGGSISLLWQTNASLLIQELVVTVWHSHKLLYLSPPRRKEICLINYTKGNFMMINFSMQRQ